MRKSLVFIFFPIIYPIILAMVWWETNINRNPSGGKTITGPYAFDKPSLSRRLYNYFTGKYNGKHR